MIAQRANFTRNMLVIIPFLAVLAAFATHYGVELLDIARRHKSLAHVGLAFALLLQPTIQSGAAYSDSLRRGLESRDRAAEWLSSNHTRKLILLLLENFSLPRKYMNK